MRGLTLATVFGVFLAGGLTAAPVPKDDKKEKTTEEKLIGKWKLVKSDAGLPDFEFVIEYKPKGKMTYTRTTKDGEASVSDGKYKLDAEKMELDWTVNEGGNDRGELSKIKKLTEDRFIIEDPEGIKEEFEKVVEKKEEKGKKDEK